MSKKMKIGFTLMFVGVVCCGFVLQYPQMAIVGGIMFFSGAYILHDELDM